MYNGKSILRYMFEKYERALWYFDRFFYIVPLYYVTSLNIPLLVYDENVSYEYVEVNDKNLCSQTSRI